MNRRRVAVVTGARSEYGLLRWLLEEIRADAELELQLVVTGAHLSPEFGSTYSEIETDGFEIAGTVDMLIAGDLPKSIAKSMGVCSIGMADLLDRLRPEILVLLGDRYELLPVAGAALVLGIPMAHISGGDVTEGAIDNEIRNAVTMMATLHFPGNQDSAARLVSMGVRAQSIFPVGEPGIENFRRLPQIAKAELCDDLGIDSTKDWVLLSYHPETRLSTDQNVEVLERILAALRSTPNIQVIATYANADAGGGVLNRRLERERESSPGFICVVPSLGQRRYCSLMRHVTFLIGNSSSGIVEAPYLGVPSISIGERQRGRHLAASVALIPGEAESIRLAVSRASQARNLRHEPDLYYGDGQTSKRIKDTLVSWLRERTPA